MQKTVQEALDLAAKDGSIELGLEFDGKVATRGERISKDQVKDAPRLQLTGEASGVYIAIAIDVDAPYVSTQILSPIVHWIQPGLYLNDNTNILKPDDACIVNWLASVPPPFSGPHRYVVILYQQPADFAVGTWESEFAKPVSIPSRCRWNVDQFVKEADLISMCAAKHFRN